MKTKMKTRKGRILKVEILTRADTDPDTSYIGEYTDTWKLGAMVVHSGEFVADIERREAILERLQACDVPALAEAWQNRAAKLGPQWDDLNSIPERGREYCFFLPYAGGESPDSKEYRRNARQDYDRMQGLSRGDWSFVGIQARAEVTLPGSDVVQRLTSGGLWGIESDSGADYLAEVERDELAGLRRELDAVGFSPRQIGLAFKSIENSEG
jgi:hypothetical protein